jgi:SAM-dependent methyltransferase
MLAVLGRQLRGVARVVARGEELPFAAGAAGAVVISSAWHWLNPERAWPEIARVLRPGGVFAVIWSGPDRSVPWVEHVLGPRRGDGPVAPPPDGPVAQPADLVGAPAPGRRWQVELPAGVPFARVEERTFGASVGYQVADLPGLAASYSRVMILPAAARPELSARLTIDLPLRCKVWPAIRT